MLHKSTTDAFLERDAPPKDKMLTVSAPDTERTNQVVVRSAMSKKRKLAVLWTVPTKVTTEIVAIHN